MLATTWFSSVLAIFLLCTISSAQLISLANYNGILIVHEKEYHQSKGNDHQKVINNIIEEIASEGKGKFKEGNTKELELVN